MLVLLLLPAHTTLKLDRLPHVCARAGRLMLQLLLRSTKPAQYAAQPGSQPGCSGLQGRMALLRTTCNSCEPCCCWPSCHRCPAAPGPAPTAALRRAVLAWACARLRGNDLRLQQECLQQRLLGSCPFAGAAGPVAVYLAGASWPRTGPARHSPSLLLLQGSSGAASELSWRWEDPAAALLIDWSQ
jgi:hypothetical protein